MIHKDRMDIENALKNGTDIVGLRQAADIANVTGAHAIWGNLKTELAKATKNPNEIAELTIQLIRCYGKAGHLKDAQQIAECGFIAAIQAGDTFHELIVSLSIYLENEGFRDQFAKSLVQAIHGQRCVGLTCDELREGLSADPAQLLEVRIRSLSKTDDRDMVLDYLAGRKAMNSLSPAKNKETLHQLLAVVFLSHRTDVKVQAAQKIVVSFSGEDILQLLDATDDTQKTLFEKALKQLKGTQGFLLLIRLLFEAAQSVPLSIPGKSKPVDYTTQAYLALRILQTVYQSKEPGNFIFDALAKLNTLYAVSGDKDYQKIAAQWRKIITAFRATLHEAITATEADFPDGDCGGEDPSGDDVTELRDELTVVLEKVKTAIGVIDIDTTRWDNANLTDSACALEIRAAYTISDWSAIVTGKNIVAFSSMSKLLKNLRKLLETHRQEFGCVFATSAQSFDEVLVLDDTERTVGHIPPVLNARTRFYDGYRRLFAATPTLTQPQAVKLFDLFVGSYPGTRQFCQVQLEALYMATAGGAVPGPDAIDLAEYRLRLAHVLDHTFVDQPGDFVALHGKEVPFWQLAGRFNQRHACLKDVVCYHPIYFYFNQWVVTESLRDCLAQAIDTKYTHDKAYDFPKVFDALRKKANNSDPLIALELNYLQHYVMAYQMLFGKYIPSKLLTEINALYQIYLNHQTSLDKTEWLIAHYALSACIELLTIDLVSGYCVIQVPNGDQTAFEFGAIQTEQKDTERAKENQTELIGWLNQLQIKDTLDLVGEERQRLWANGMMRALKSTNIYPELKSSVPEPVMSQ